MNRFERVTARGLKSWRDIIITNKRMTTFIKSKIKKSIGQTNIDKSKVAVHKMSLNIILKSEQIFDSMRH